MQAKTQTLTSALMAFATLTNGHITMKYPAPFGSVGSTKSLTSSPLTSANYPCQVGSNPAKFYSKEGLDNKFEIGKPQTISFEGSAVHGGGSCQLALTKDPQPSASTSWAVILSIEGSCPSKTGEGVDEYEFTIPDGIAPGEYVFAWTWIAKLSGTQEYYMNCAPVTITGGSSNGTAKRDDEKSTGLVSRDTEFPELMVANLAEINDCKSVLGSDPTYPDPGPNVLKPGTNSKFAPFTGTNCGPKGAKKIALPGSGPGSDLSPGGAPGGAPGGPPTPSAGISGGFFTTGFVTSTTAAAPSTPVTSTTSAVPTTPLGPTTPVVPTTPAASTTPPAPTTTSANPTTPEGPTTPPVPTTPVASTASSAASMPTESCDEDIHGPSSTQTSSSTAASSTAASSTAASSTAASSTAASSTAASSTAASSTSASPTTPTPSSSSTFTTIISTPSSTTSISAPSSSPSSGAGAGAGAGKLAGPCTAEGMFNCIAGTSFQRCASGSWSVVMDMPPSTKCIEGQTMTLWRREGRGRFGAR